VPFELSLRTDALQAFLAEQGWLQDDERVLGAERAGEGNMNRTLRARTDRRTLILKQSCDYCAKFPEIPAPIERIETEVEFYRLAARSTELAARMPKVLAFAPEHHLALLEDLGAGSDLLSLYSGDPLLDGELAVLGALARELHRLALAPSERAALRNRAMRTLNHEHIFDLPLRERNGLELEEVVPGLSALAAEAKADRPYVEALSRLGRLYLDADGPSLLHGDYYPGSFLRTERGLAIIDPEFAFFGPPEFDLSVLVAHLIFAGGEGRRVVDVVLDAYGAPVDRALIEGFAGAELMRRTIGVSQLPIPGGLDPRRGFLEQSRIWVHGWRTLESRGSGGC
jgi:5-methylthioribose kinase